MFHLLTGLMAVGTLAAMIAVFAIPLWLGPLVQALIRFFSRGKAARWVPAVLGSVGLVWSVWSLGLESQWFPVWGICLYWAVYGLLLWAADALAARFRAWTDSRKAAKKE